MVEAEFVEEDLTQVEAAAALSPKDVAKLRKYNQARQRDYVRAALALLLVGLLMAITLAALWVVAADPEKKEPIIELLKLLFTPVVGLVGSAIGFYFGAGSSANMNK